MLKSKGDNQKVIKAFAITTVISLILAVGILILTDSFPSGSYSSDSYIILWAFIFLAVLFGLIAGTYKYNKIKEDIGCNEKKISPEEELKNQIENYYNLGIFESKKGQAVLAIGFVVGLTLVFSFFDMVPILDAVSAFIVYGTLAVFIYKGHRWAMYLGIVLWTLEKGYQIFSSNGERLILVIIFFWFWLVTILYSAIKVENERKKRKDAEKKSENIKPAYADRSALEGKLFCSSCGKEINYRGSFCKFCGNKLI
ncbi:MAG: hypothetical protein COU40_00485 [Candidatus Moranbacteria bacterium CG10_big_fil_rev_8_21_14_0_10_35_21]|nr:MAG: hypothetical protein COU40_00485 [Candidatus Moranbacteria bacterium CG10_big_fil_rev_8_21_14_0_10_35_21]